MSNFFTIHPNSSHSIVAAEEVQKSIITRRYPHWVKPMGKLVGANNMQFGYLSITTDPYKAEVDGYFSPDEWINSHRRTVSKLFHRVR